MFCSFCKKGASKLATHYLCDCCLVHLKCCESSAEKQWATTLVNKTTPESGKKLDKGKLECIICLEVYPEDELQQHWETCMAQLVFRCTVCDGDYVSKEGVWNHLVMHDIADGIKETHYQEMRATYEMHRCMLCNDQRGYQEKNYWKHVHEDHDGFFLRCSECGENFRSEKRKADHVLNHCKVRKQSVTSNSGGFEMDQEVINIVLPVHGKAAAQFDKVVEELELSQIEQSINNPGTNLTNQQHSLAPELPIKDLDLSSTEYNQLTCHSERQYKCTYCSQICSAKDDLSNHMSQHLTDPKSVESSGQKAEKSDFYVINHDLDLISVDQEHVDFQLSETNFADDTDIIFASRDDTQPVHTDIHCLHCDKEFQSESILTHHIEHCHELTVSDVCGLTATNKNHRLTCYTEPMFKCPNCPMTFHHNVAYKSHLVQHDEKLKFPCELCDWKFLDAYRLSLHMEREHYKNNGRAGLAYCNQQEQEDRQEQEYQLQSANIAVKEEMTVEEASIQLEAHKVDDANVLQAEETSLVKIENLIPDDVREKSSPITHCPVCGENFDDEYQMCKHVETIHQCTCEMTFTSTGQPKNLKQPKYDCYECLQSFSTKLYFYKHMVAHERQAKLQCNICNYRYGSRTALRSHMVREHGIIKSNETPCTCSICGVTVTGTAKLRHHKLRFHTEPNFQCSHCPRKFVTKAIYRVHLKSHKRAGIFPCNFCCVTQQKKY